MRFSVTSWTFSALPTRRGAPLLCVVQSWKTALHPEQGYRRCMGLIRLDRHYEPERIEAACERALAAGARSYQSVKTILENGLDRLPLPSAAPGLARPVPHAHLRGPGYYN